MFGPTLRFEAPLTTLEFDAALLASRHAASAATLREFLRDAPQSVFLKQVGGVFNGRSEACVLGAQLGGGITFYGRLWPPHAAASIATARYRAVRLSSAVVRVMRPSRMSLPATSCTVRRVTPNSSATSSAVNGKPRYAARSCTKRSRTEFGRG